MQKEITINGRKANINLKDGFLSINYRGQELNLELNEFLEISGIINVMSERPEFSKDQQEKQPIKAETIINKIVEDMNNSDYQTELQNELRDEFAKAAMQSLMVVGRWVGDEKSLSVRAYITANAMLEERKEHIKKG